MRKGVCETPHGEMGLLPSPSTCQREARELERLAVCKYNLGIIENETDTGVTLRFDFEEHLRLLLEGHGLADIAASTDPNVKPVMLKVTLLMVPWPPTICSMCQLEQ